VETHRVEVSSPYFEDLHVGQVFDDAPGVTLTTAHAAFHTALFNDRLRLPLDAPLSRAVTGRTEPLVHPMVVCNVAIGQTTTSSQRVRGNLFYRGLLLRQPVFIGDTLRTTTKVVGLNLNKARPGRAATGMVALEVQVENQDGATVLHYWRCPMIPCRDAWRTVGPVDSFDTIPPELDPDAVRAAVPSAWRLDAFRERVPGRHLDAVAAGTEYVLESRDTVSSAPELARLTLNLAMTHTDAAASLYKKRLVYGGHTISMAAAHLTRALPNLVTIIGWRSCDHTAPVFEGDVLRTQILVEAVQPLASGGLVDFRARVFAERGPEAPEPGSDIPVLDWRLVGLLA